ncbi:hypothetical protein VTL71DRAFT_5813 [Oculimacula yallundae]|uniref:Major facilitator superfamily (MFS) profile domain-containing protein n=1 Tax=Oculimacula yallundae TaxID=86028 RepID=A0ABR4BYK3_9HELO
MAARTSESETVQKIDDDRSISQHIELKPHITYDDPHQAALEDNPEVAERLSASSALAVFFLGLSFVAPVGCGFVLVSGILLQIGQTLGDTINIVWIAGGWSIGSSASFSIAGGLSDIFGRRNPVLVGQVLTIIGAIIGATANSTKVVAAGSTVIGFGCGFIFVAYAGIPEMLPNKYRGAGIGWTELCLNLPWSTFSVLLANLLYIHASWRWVYYITIIYGVVCFIGCALFYYPPSRPRRDFDKTRWQEVKELDHTGLFLYTCGLTVLLIGLTWAGQDGHAWKSASVIAPLVVGSVLLAVCFGYDGFIARQALFPADLFVRVREFTLLLVIVFVAGMIFYSMAALLPQMSLFLYTPDGIDIGIIQIPAGVGSLLGGWVLPSLSHKIKNIKLQIIVGLVIQTLFTGLYAVAMPGNKKAWMAFQFFGQGCFTWITSLAYVAAGLHVPQSELGIASGLIGTFRSAGGSVGNAIFNTILRGVVADQLAPRIMAAALKNDFPADKLAGLVPAVINNAVGVPSAFAELTAATPAVQVATAQAFKAAYGYAFQRVAYATIPFGVIAIVAAFFIKDPSIYLTNHTSIHMEKEVISGKSVKPAEK